MRITLSKIKKRIAGYRVSDPSGDTNVSVFVIIYRAGWILAIILVCCQNLTDYFCNSSLVLTQ